MSELDKFIIWYIRTNGVDYMTDEEIVCGYYSFCNDRFNKYVDNAYPQYLTYCINKGPFSSAG